MLIARVSEQVQAGTRRDEQLLSRVERLRMAGRFAAPIGFAAGYFSAVAAAEWLGHPALPQPVPSAAGALLLSALLLTEQRRWWLYLLLALVMQLAAEWPTYPAIEILVRNGANAASALIAASAIALFRRGPLRFDCLRNSLLLVAFGALIGSGIAALITSVALAIGRADVNIGFNIMAILLAHAFATVTITPVTVHAVLRLRAGPLDAPLDHLPEVATLVVALIALGTSAFVWPHFPSVKPIWLAAFNVFLACAVLLLAALLSRLGHLKRDLHITRQRFEGMFMHHVMPMALWREGAGAVTLNDAYLRLNGMNRHDLTSSPVTAELLSLFSCPAVDEDCGDTLTRFRKSKHLLHLADGRSAPVVITRYPVGGASEGMLHALDLSAVSDAESGRQRVESLHAAVLDSLHERIAIIDGAGLLLETNESWRMAAEACDPTSAERVRPGESFLEACAREAAKGDADAVSELRALRAVLSGAESRCHLERVSGPPEAAVWLEVSIERLRRPEGGAVITCIDATSRKRAELEARIQQEQLTHLGRVAVLGQLSGAFAHELNQPLTSILGNAEAALRLLDCPDRTGELQDILRDIVDEDLRAAQVIQRLRALFDKADSVRETVNLNAVVHEVLGLCRSELIARNVRVHTELAPVVPTVQADRVQMQQVILNLLMNACDAVAGQPVSARTVCVTTRTNPQASFVALSVADSGPGITDTDLERIFQPFFSSKSHGMGLGLAICRSVAESHNGRLWAESAGGAVFHLELPVGGVLS